MSISVIVSAYACLPNQGSEPGYGWNWAYTLNKNSLTVHCITQSIGKSAIEKEITDRGLNNLYFHYVEVPNWVEWFCARTGLIGMYFHYSYWQWEASKKAKKITESHNVDLLHHVTYGSCQQGSFLYKVKKPFIFGPVGGGQHAPVAFKKYFHNKWNIELIRKGISWLFEKFNPACFKTLSNAELVVCSNKETFDLVSKYRKNKKTIYGYDTGLPKDCFPTQYPLRYPSSKLRLLWVGRMFTRKGLEVIFDSLSKVDTSRCDYVLDIVGFGPMEDQISKWTKDYNLEGRINWHGKLPFDEVKKYYQNTDVFVFTSLRDSIGVQLLEAMAWGAPIITLDMHGGGLLVGEECGIKIPVTIPEETTLKFAEAVHWMNDHPGEREAMGRKGFELAKKLSWDAKVEEMIEMYHKITKSVSKLV